MCRVGIKSLTQQKCHWKFKSSTFRTKQTNWLHLAFKPRTEDVFSMTVTVMVLVILFITSVWV